MHTLSLSSSLNTLNLVSNPSSPSSVFLSIGRPTLTARAYLTHTHAQYGFPDPRIYRSCGDADFSEKGICRGVNRAGILDNSIFENPAESVRAILLIHVKYLILIVSPPEMTSEEVTAKRRAERKQFKADRAAAIAAVAEEAEHIFATQGRVITPALSGPSIPSAAMWKPPSLISAPTNDPPSPLQQEHLDPLIHIEHLQLTLQEAFFLLWTLDCLTILDPSSSQPMSLQEIWQSFQLAHLPPTSSTLASSTPLLQFDNPFLINYIVYHHYRSLGWVIKGGVKFCVDYLLYKRGPVFAHAEYDFTFFSCHE